MSSHEASSDESIEISTWACPPEEDDLIIDWGPTDSCLALIVRDVHGQTHDVPLTHAGAIKVAEALAVVLKRLADGKHTDTRTTPLRLL